MKNKHSAASPSELYKVISIEVTVIDYAIALEIPKLI